MALPSGLHSFLVLLEVLKRHQAGKGHECSQLLVRLWKQLNTNQSFVLAGQVGPNSDKAL